MKIDMENRGILPISTNKLEYKIYSPNKVYTGVPETLNKNVDMNFSKLFNKLQTDKLDMEEFIGSLAKAKDCDKQSLEKIIKEIEEKYKKDLPFITLPEVKKRNAPAVEQTDKMEGKKFDNGKSRWSLLPKGTISVILEVLELGARKYGFENFIHVENARQRYYDAGMRHLDAWWHGTKLDEESGKSHLAHCACCILFLLWFELNEVKSPIK